MSVCPNCNGTGHIYGPHGVLRMNADWKECPSCRGKGEVTGYWQKCDRCGGWGWVGYVFLNPDPCPECNTLGVVPSEPREERETGLRGRSIRIELE